MRQVGHLLERRRAASGGRRAWAVTDATGNLGCQFPGAEAARLPSVVPPGSATLA